MRANCVIALLSALGCGSPEETPPLPAFGECPIDSAATTAVDPAATIPPVDDMVLALPGTIAIVGSIVPNGGLPPRWGQLSVVFQRTPVMEVFDVTRVGTGCPPTFRVPLAGGIYLADGVKLVQGNGTLEWISAESWFMAFGAEYIFNTDGGIEPAARDAAVQELAAVVFAESRPELTPDTWTARGSLFMVGDPSGGEFGLLMNVNPDDRTGTFVGPLLDAHWQPTTL